VEARGLNPASLSAPWFAPWSADALGDLPALAALAPAALLDALNRRARARDLRNSAAHPIVFAPADDAGDLAYEAHIFATGRVPTRAVAVDGGHDLFNALAWLRFPQAKAALNARQAAQLARDGVRASRGPERDAATLIDENGLVLATMDASVFDALSAHDWQWLFVAQRARWHRDIVPQMFGHALMQKLLVPYASITAHVVALRDRFDSDAQLDSALAARLAQGELSTRDLLPLPVLGIPGWWPANESAVFYDDARVFRPARRAA